MVLPACTDPYTGGALRGVCVGAMPTRDLCVTLEDTGFGPFTYWSGCNTREFLLSAYTYHYTADFRPGSYVDRYYDADTCDGLDNDCDGSVDENFASTAVDCGCGPPGATACQNGLVVDVCPEYVPTPEVCDGLDNDCDGLVDQLDPGLVVPDCASDLGVCAERQRPLALCAGEAGWLECTAADYAYTAFPDYRADDDCDGVDNDCDGVADDDFVGHPVTCAGGCAAFGTVACVDGDLVDTCELGESSPELCDGNDNDCDGLVDASDPGLARVLCSEQRGVCNGAVRPLDLCDGGDGWGACRPGDYAAHAFPAYAVNDAVCDGLDNDCDGAVDEEYVGQLQLCPQGSCQPVARDTCANGTIVSGCEPTGPGCPTGPGNECEECDPAVALTVYGIAENSNGVAQGSFRCTSSAAGLTCDIDANGYLAITDALWCGP
jgi:hypothetical protein